MKTNMAANSLAAIWSMRDAGDLPVKEKLVYDALLKHGPMTREQIGERTAMKEGSACGRVARLMEKGLVVGVANMVNPKTDALNEIVDLAPHRKVIAMPVEQVSLFEELAA